MRIHQTLIGVAVTLALPLALPPGARAQSATSGVGGEPTIGSLAPTAEETKLLELINAARMNPNDGPEPAVQPLVFDPALMRGARLHSYYQALHGITHTQEPGREGFSGVEPWDREPSCSAENCYATSGGLTAGGPFSAWMNSSGHRANNLNGDYRLVGLAFDARGPHHIATATFGNSDQRYAGGVAYCDYNGNGVYDVGEGIASAVLQYEGRTIRVCPSGAYTIPISTGGGEITIIVDTMVGRKSIPAGTANYKLDFVPSSGEMIALQEFWEDQERLIQAIRTQPIEEAEAMCEQMLESYGGTRMRGWFLQAQNCLEMRQIYMRIAVLEQENKMPQRRTLVRLLNQLRRMQMQNTTTVTWDCGMHIGEAYYALAAEGVVNEELLRSNPPVVEEEAAEDAAAQNEDNDAASAAADIAEAAEEEVETHYYFGPDDEL